MFDRLSKVTNPIIIATFICGYSPSAFSGGADTKISCEETYKHFKKKYEGGLKNNDYLEEQLKYYIKKCPNRKGLNVLMAYLKITMGENKIALKFSNKAIRLDPNNPSALHVKGMVLGLLGRHKESLNLLEKSINLEENNITFWVNYCSSLEYSGKTRKAVKECSKAINKFPNNSELYSIRGKAYKKLGKKEKAKKDFKKSISLKLKK